MKLEEWKTYRTRFLVKAKQLSSSLTFVDHLGRQHCGRKGDYLVESSDGVLSIAPRRIFEDIYVPMSLLHEPGSCEMPIRPSTLGEPKLDRLKFKAVEIEEVKFAKSPIVREPVDETGLVRQNMVHSDLVRPDIVRPEEAPRSRARKLPQPCGDRRVSASRLGLM